MPSRIALVLLAALAASPARAQIVPDEVPDLPFLAEANRRGFGTIVEQPGEPRTPGAVDGAVGDWVGSTSRFGGTAIYSRGEYVYQDHLFDAWGSDDGADAERLATLDPLAETEPRTFRLDHAVNYAIDELGAPVIPPYTGEQVYGDADPDGDGDNDLVDVADIVEVRVASNGGDVDLLVRTTTLVQPGDLAVLVLADTTPGTNEVEVGFQSGLRSSVADVGFLLTDSSAEAIDLATGNIIGTADVAVNADGWTNALEARLPRELVARADGLLRLAVATGIHGGPSIFAPLGQDVNVANVAFRRTEPVVSFFEKNQALALQAGTIDPFFAEIDEASLVRGRTQTYVPAAGYHDRIFRSTEAISEERSENGVWQHYGLFLPSTYNSETPSPLQLWLHFRGGKAHTAAAVLPRTMEDYGEEVGTIVVSPRGRGTSTWYVGKGHVDVLEVWEDVHEHFSIDETRRYVSGHSMGGWGTYLMTVLYPDRFAAGMPVAGPVTQGAWTGLDIGEECDGYAFEEYTPCYIEANGSRPRDQHTRRLLDNLRHVPLAIFQGAIDELVPVSGVTRQVEKLVELGYTHRYYLFPNHEHYTHPIMDEWEEGVRYMHQFATNPNPRRVTYVRDMPFEKATEEISSGGVPLSFDFDSAYWMSGLEPDPADADDGVARFDGESLAIVEPVELSVPEAGGPTAPGQVGPFVMIGLGPLADPTATSPAAANGFSVELTGAAAVTLDFDRMAIDPVAPIDGAVTIDRPLTLTLVSAAWGAVPVVTGASVTSFDGTSLVLDVPSSGSVRIE